MKKSCDIAIAGAGIGGLIAGTILSRKGYKVIIAEKNERIGGYYGAFCNENGAVFDYGAAYLLSCGEKGEVSELLNEVDPEHTIRFYFPEYTDMIVYKGRRYKFPKGFDNLEKYLIEEFPEEESGIKELIAWLKVYADSGEKKDAESGKFFIKNYRRDYKEFLESMIGSETLKAILSIRIQSIFSSLILMAGFMTECYGKGVAYPVGGSGALCNKLADLIVANGGELITGKRGVKYVSGADNTINSLILEDGTVIEAEYFIHNGDPFSMNKMLENSVSETQLTDRKIGHASLSVFLETDGLDIQDERCGRIYLCEEDDVFETYKKLEEGKLPEEPIVKLHIPTLHDKTLAKAGHHVLRLETDVYHVNEQLTQEEYEAYAAKMIRLVEKRYLPGLSEHIIFKRIITPSEYEKLFLSAYGSGTGWLHNTKNYMVKLFNQNSLYKNAFIVGQWGTSGSGIRQITVSAKKAIKDMHLKERS